MSKRKGKHEMSEIYKKKTNYIPDEIREQLVQIEKEFQVCCHEAEEAVNNYKTSLQSKQEKLHSEIISLKMMIDDIDDQIRAADVELTEATITGSGNLETIRRKIRSLADKKKEAEYNLTALEGAAARVTIKGDDKLYQKAVVCYDKCIAVQKRFHDLNIWGIIKEQISIWESLSHHISYANISRSLVIPWYKEMTELHNRSNQ